MGQAWDTQGLCNKHTHKIKYHLIIEMNQVNVLYSGKRCELGNRATMYNVLKPYTK